MNKPFDPKSLPAELASVRKVMMRAALKHQPILLEDFTVVYGRFSGRNQKEASAIRQNDVCTGYAGEQNFQLLENHFFADRAHTGDSLDGRKALEAVMNLARARKIKRILVYSWCRLSRRPGHAMMIFDELSTLGVEVHVCSGSQIGKVNHTQAMFLSIAAKEEREKLLRTTNYASFAAAEKGRNMAGIPFGFRKGQNSGQIVVHEAEMEIVQLIFEYFVIDRMHPRKIAYLLNRSGKKGAKGRPWNPDIIIGLLRNPKFVGYLVYGVTTTVRTPGKAKTARTAGSLKRLKHVKIDELDRVDTDLFMEANLRLDQMAERYEQEKELQEPQERASKSLLLFHGRYRCPCGSSMRMATAIGKSGIRHLVCHASFAFGNCDFTRSTSSLFVEGEILRELRDNILSDEAVDEFNRTYVAKMREARDEVLAKRAIIAREITEIDKWLDAKMLQSFKDARQDERSARVCEGLENEIERLQGELDELKVPEETTDIPNIEVGALRSAMTQLILRTPLKDPDAADLKLVGRLRALIRKVVIARGPEGSGYVLEIHAALGSLAPRPARKADDEPLDLFADEPTEEKRESDGPVRIFRLECDDPVRGNYDPPELLDRIAEAIESREYLTSDADWSAVEPLWRHWEHPEKRDVLDATLFYLRFPSLGLRAMPLPFVQGYALEYQVNRMIAKGCWASALEALTRIQSPAVEGLDTARLDRRLKRFEAA